MDYPSLCTFAFSMLFAATNTQLVPSNITLPFSYPLDAQIVANVTFDLPYVDCYFVLVASVSSLEEAKSVCRSKGDAQVAVFRSASEFRSVFNQIDWDSVPGYREDSDGGWVGQLWTGFQRTSQASQFRWLNQAPINIEPGSSSLCLIIRSTGLLSYTCTGGKPAGVLCQTTTYDKVIPITLPSVVDETNFCQVYLLPSSPDIKTVVAIPGHVQKTFVSVEGLFTWSEAQTACQQISDSSNRGLKTSLAVISSITEYQLLRSKPDFLTFESNGYWVGLRRHPEGLHSNLDLDGIGAAFIWLDGIPLSYFAFLPHQPAKNAGNEKCVALVRNVNGSIGYNDYRCLVPDANGDIPDWLDDDDLCFGALCQFAVEWL